jgi:hypothetical protein
MILAEQAFLKRRVGVFADSIALFSEAYDLESQAARTLSTVEEPEPSRSVLFRSAASLALNAKRFREAEKMVSFGLSGNPPEEIANELRNISEQIGLERHLDLNGIVLSDDELQLTLAGPEIGFGMARSEELLKRIEVVEKLSYRIAERQSGLPFREKGKIPKSIRELYSPYFSIPRAASFAITIRFGEQSKNMLLFEERPVQKMVDELVSNLELINNSEDEKLRTIINDEDYYNNFVALTKKLSPDLKNIELVGITISRKGSERRLPFTRLSREIRMPLAATPEQIRDAERIEVTGRLEWASKSKSEVRLFGDEGITYRVIVPRGVMSDIVKPYWDENVRIIGHKVKDRNVVYFEDIEKL